MQKGIAYTSEFRLILRENPHAMREFLAVCKSHAEKAAFGNVKAERIERRGAHHSSTWKVEVRNTQDGAVKAFLSSSAMQRHMVLITGRTATISFGCLGRCLNWRANTRAWKRAGATSD